MREDITLCEFTKGELSPRLKGRTDYKGYYSGLATCLNAVVMPQGGVTRRPGTMLKALAKDQSDGYRHVIEIPFVFGTVTPTTPTPQAYQLEFGNGYIRVDTEDGPIVNPQAVTGAANNGAGLIRLAINSTTGINTGNTMTVSAVTGTVEANGTWTVTVIDGTHVDLQGSVFQNAYVGGGETSTIVEIPVPYQTADLPAIGYCQSQDTLYLDHPNYPPATLGRVSNTDWVYAATQYRDGPYLPYNTTATEWSANGTTGNVTVSFTSILGINSTPTNTGQGFLATDVGRSIRLGDGGGNYGWVIITAVNSTTQVAATVQAAVNYGAGGAIPANGSATWALGKWSGTTGYPWLPMFWQQRLWHLATNNQISAVEGSVTADFTNFAPSATGGGAVVAANALDWIISDDQVNAIRGVAPAGSAAAMQLGIFTAAGEDILQPATTSQGLSSTNVQVYRETSYGNAAYVRPLRIGKEVLMVDPPGRQVHAWQWQWAVNGYLGPNRTVDAEHITRCTPPDLQGIIQWCYQQNPYGVIWAIRGDGALIACTYLPEQQIFGAWHRHILGGQYYGGPPLVESVCCTPSPDGTYSELSLVVLRTVGGVVTRTKEVATRYFDGQPVEQAWFVDCAIQSALTFPAATLTPPALANSASLADQAPAFGVPGAAAVEFAASAGVFSNASVGDYLRLNNGIWTVTQYVDAEHVMAVCWQPMTSLKPAAAGAWSCTPPAQTFTNLAYLDGETAQILGDGADFGTQVVAGGEVSIAALGSASLATVGLPATGAIVGMPFDPERAMPADAQGKPKRVDHLYLRFHESLGCDFGVRTTDDMTFFAADNTEPIETRSAGDLMGAAPALFSGIIALPNPGGYDREQQLEITWSGPMPLTVLAMGAKADVGEEEPYAP